MSTTVAEDIVAELVADAAVVALVTTKRIFPLVMPGGTTLPAIVYTVVDEVDEASTDGTPATRLVNARVQVDCYGHHKSQAEALGQAVNAVLGNLQRPELSAWRLLKRDVYDEETTYHSVSMDFGVWRR